MAVYNDGYDNEEERRADLAWEYRKGGPNDPNLYPKEEPEEDAEEEEVRLIDAEALKNDLFIKFGNQLPNGLFEAINNAPTVDREINVYPKGEVIVQEKRPEARWIKNKAANLDELGYVLCSNCRCGFKRYDRGTRKSDLPWIDGQAYELENRCNYCPTCGAKMLNANGPTEEE